MLYFTSLKENEHIKDTDIQICDVKYIKHYFKDKDYIGVDTETTGFDPHKNKLLTLQLGDADNQFVIDASTIDIVIFKDLLEQHNLILQNAKFDLRFFYKLGIWPNKIYDTFLAETKLYQGRKDRRRDLETLAKTYCATENVDKSLRPLIHYKGLIKEVIEYAGNDVRYLHEIHLKQLKKAKEEGLEKAINLENRFVPALAYTEYCGMYINEHDWKIKVQKAYDKVIESKQKLDQYIKDNNLSKYIDNQLDLFSTDKKVLINWNSSDQVIPLFKDLGINVIVVEKGTKKQSIDASNLLKQIKDFDIIPLYLEYKKWVKDYSTYGESFLKKISKETGRLHTTFTQIVDTGRMASGGKNRSTKEEYINFQNIPATPEEKDREEGMLYARQCIQPQEGNVFVNADYSGQEQIVLANKSQDKDLIHFYNQNLGDMHSFVASKIYPELKDISLKDIKKNHKTERQIAKSAGFALNYGGSGWTVANNLNIPIKEGERVEKAYFEAFWEQRTHTYTGEKGFKQFYEIALRELKEGDTILVMGVPRKSSERFEDFFIDWNKKRVNKGVKMKIIFSHDCRQFGEMRAKMKLTEVRYIKQEMQTPAWIDIFHDYVATLNIYGEPVCFLIKDKNSAESYRQYFDMIWKQAKK